MALIELYHVIADHLPVKSGEEIVEGDFVKLDPVSGEIILCNTAGERAYGVAGDTKSTSVSGLPATNTADPGNVPFVNRVSDSFDETRASGRMTVYHGGGKFATNRFGTVSTTIGAPLYVNSTGKLTTTSAGAAFVVGELVKAAGAYDSGVPGIDVNGSMSLGSYIEFKLVI
jgi:hypothetical protein